MDVRVCLWNPGGDKRAGGAHLGAVKHEPLLDRHKLSAYGLHSLLSHNRPNDRHHGAQFTPRIVRQCNQKLLVELIHLWLVEYSAVVRLYQAVEVAAQREDVLLIFLVAGPRVHALLDKECVESLSGVQGVRNWEGGSCPFRQRMRGALAPHGV
jgi:hypothetical protein